MAPLTQTALTVVTLAVMLLGLAGLILVIFPGLNIIWLAALVYGLITGSNKELYQRSLDININLWWGLVLLVFGVIMFVAARRAASKPPESGK